MAAKNPLPAPATDDHGRARPRCADSVPGEAVTYAGGVEYWGDSEMLYGSCTCGWVGKLRTHVAHANQDVLDHNYSGNHLEDMPSTTPATLAETTQEG